MSRLSTDPGVSCPTADLFRIAYSGIAPAEMDKIAADTRYAYLTVWHYDDPLTAVHATRHTEWKFGTFDNVQEEAAEEGYPVPTSSLVQKARIVHTLMLSVINDHYDIYPMPDGEVAVDAQHKENSVIVLCEPHGRFLCLVNIEGRSRRRRFSKYSDPCIGYIRAAVREMYT